MNPFKANQKLLFKAETVFNLKPLERYEILFSFLDTSSLERLYSATGRPPVGYAALLKALIAKDEDLNGKIKKVLKDLKVNLNSRVKAELFSIVL